MVFTVKTENFEMKYVKFGGGKKTLVILPGIYIKPVSGSYNYIEEAYKDYVNEYTFYIFDRKSNMNEGYLLNEMAEDTMSVIESLGLKSFYINGNSQGGEMALYMAAKYPSYVEKIVVSGAFAKKNSHLAKYIDMWYIMAKENKKKELVESLIDAIYGDITLKKYREAYISSFNDISDDELASFAIMDIACNTYDLFDSLKSIKAKTLVVGAEGDKVVPIEEQKELAGEIPNAVFYSYGKEYGHCVCDETTDFRDRMFDFFAKK